MEVFAAMVDVLDENVGRLVDFLKKKGRLRQHADPFLFRQRRLSIRAHPAVVISNRGIQNPIGLTTRVGRTRETHRFASTNKINTKAASRRR